jgi:hypothetical protein
MVSRREKMARSIDRMKEKVKLIHEQMLEH